VGVSVFRLSISAMCIFIFIFYPLVMKAKKERKKEKGPRHQLKELSIPSFSIVSHTFMHDVRTVPFSLPSLNPARSRRPTSPSPPLTPIAFGIKYRSPLIYIYHHISLNSFIPSPWQTISKRCH
jgi:hypothetical protein